MFFVVLAGLWLAMSGHAHAADGPIFAGPALVATGQAPAAGAVEAMFEQGREGRFQGVMVHALGHGVDFLLTDGYVAPTLLTL